MRTLLLLVLYLGCSLSAAQPYDGWAHGGSVFILTTPDGADLPASAVLENFPLLIRLHGDWFDFRQAQPHGEDLRVALPTGEAIPLQVEQWDSARGEAAVWVRIPKITGQARQELRLFWGKPDAASESSGAAVFGEANGYASVWHLGADIQDQVGALKMKDSGTSAVPGIVGGARHLPGGAGLFGGDHIANYPSGGNPHSTEAWFRAERANTTVLGWGNEGGNRGSKVRLQLRGPTHVHVDSDFADVDAPQRLALGEWVQVVHTYADGEGRLYLDGQLAATAKMLLNIKSPARLWLGGWYNQYDFVGDLDEVRISRVARSPEWIKLTYENQKPLQTAVGPIALPGNTLRITPPQAKLAEGTSQTFQAEAGGAQKIYWSLQRGIGPEQLVAVDRLSYRFDAGRVQGDESCSLICKVITAGGAKVVRVPLTIQEAIPDPALTLSAPAAWNGRGLLELRAQLNNAAALPASTPVQFAWHITGGAAIAEPAGDKLLLKRSQFTGPLTITASAQNGGALSTAAARIVVTEPSTDASVARKPEPDEQPVDHQFFARDDSGSGTLHYRGKLETQAEAVFLKLYAGETLLKTERQKTIASPQYALSVALKPALTAYRIEFGVTNNGADLVVRTVEDLLCGDAYLIMGQSNAVADVKDNPETSDWIRSFGNMNGGVGKGWARAVRGSVSGDLGRIGYWGFDVAKELVRKYGVPICIINGAVGGTRIDQHLPNPANHADRQTLYGKLHERVLAARLTHGVRGLLWYQGENNQGAASPSGEEDWKSYQQHFIELAAVWKGDYPNLRNYYVLQFWPDSCAMGGTLNGDMTGEVIRTLPTLFSNLRAMSVLGVVSPGSGKSNCHFAWQGYAQIAQLVTPMLEVDHYGWHSPQAVTAPNLRRAWVTNAAGTELALEFDQPMLWSDTTRGLLYLDNEPAPIASGAAAGNTITLHLSQASPAKRLTYLKGKEWDGTQANLLYGTNRIAALTFCEVPLERPSRKP